MLNLLLLQTPPTLCGGVIFKNNVPKMQHSGYNAINGKFLSISQSHVRHCVIRQLEIPNVIQLNVTQSPTRHELTQNSQH